MSGIREIKGEGKDLESDRDNTCGNDDQIVNKDDVESSLQPLVPGSTHTFVGHEPKVRDVDVDDGPVSSRLRSSNIYGAMKRPKSLPLTFPTNPIRRIPRTEVDDNKLLDLRSSTLPATQGDESAQRDQHKEGRRRSMELPRPW